MRKLRTTMKRSLLVLIATLALVLGLSASALAATADPHASCGGLAGASRAGQSGAEAEMVFGVLADAEANGQPPGATFGGFARFHDQTAEICLD
jgi:hypothetical protein